MSRIHRFSFIHVIATGLLTAALHAEPISPFLVGNNLWWAERGKAETTPSENAMSAVPGAGISLIRIGGRTFDDTLPSDEDLLTWVKRIRRTGAEPFIQVSRHVSPERAAATVTFLNETSGQNVKWWSIGNEPWLQAKHTGKTPSEAGIASEVETYFKPIAAAMKEADPAIRIFGVESEDLQPGFHARLFGGENNIAGKVPGKDYHYCDGLTWHRYPQERGAEPAYGGLLGVMLGARCRT